jgi:coenzyme F420-reducing hydrogenase delta subunit
MRVLFFLCENSGYPLYEGLNDKKTGWEAVKLSCSGLVEKNRVLEALNTRKFDKVVVIGCFEGACRYLYGNVRCRKRIDALKKDLASLQLDPGLIEFYPFTSSMKEEFEKLAERFRD